MKFLRMKPGHGEVLIAEGDVEMAEDEERLVEEFRRQLDQGLWAAVPSRTPDGRRLRDRRARVRTGHAARLHRHRRRDRGPPVGPAPAAGTGGARAAPG